MGVELKPVDRKVDPSGETFNEFDFLDGSLLTEGTRVEAKFNKEPIFEGVVSIVSRSIDHTKNTPRYYSSCVTPPRGASIYLWGVGMLVRRLPPIRPFNMWEALMEDDP